MPDPCRHRDGRSGTPGVERTGADRRWSPRRRAYFGSALGREDCLSLTVWTPDPSASARRLVMVSIHYTAAGQRFVRFSSALPQDVEPASDLRGTVCRLFPETLQ